MMIPGSIYGTQPHTIRRTFIANYWSALRKYIDMHCISEHKYIIKISSTVSHLSLISVRNVFSEIPYT